MRKLVLILSFALFVSCATVSNYPLELSYQPKAHEGGGKGTVAVPLLNDKRAIGDKRFIGMKDDEARFISLFNDPSFILSNAFRSNLESKGYTVNKVNEIWDGSVQAIRPDWGDMVVGGSIEDFSITSKGDIPKTEYVCSIKLRIVFADPKTKTILHQERIDASSSYVTVYFSREKAQELINSAMAEAVERSLSEVGAYFPKQERP